MRNDAGSSVSAQRLPFVLSVGVTGHRSDALAEHGPDEVRERIRGALMLAAASAEAVRSRRPSAFEDGPTLRRLVSPIADGADQIAAEVALNLGWELQVVMPFDGQAYRSSLADAGARNRFDQLLERASTVLELPGSGPGGEDGYVMAGRATVAHADVILAIWDGRPARGLGGTADVVRLALERGTAVIHIPPRSDRQARLLWSAFDPNVVTRDDAATIVRPLDQQHVEAALEGILTPPTDPEEAAFLALFQNEQPRRFRARVEYPLLLALTGVGRFGLKDVRESISAARVKKEWADYLVNCADAHQLSAPVQLLERAYSQADQLATHFAQTYRSGHIFGFVLGSFAVCLGLSAFMAPSLKMPFAAIELLITLAIIANAWIGSRHEWHRRWLDYRQLAERLRPMRSLKLLGVAAPDPPGTETDPVPRRWVDFYAAAVWRAIGCPTGKLDEVCTRRLANAIAEHEIAPQIAYHRRNAVQISTLDQRLNRIGTVLFAITLLVSLATVVGVARHASFVTTYGNWFSLVSSGFPALGTAIFGIRFQGDFGGDALRSETTASTLGLIDVEMRGEVTLSRAADLTEQAARVMLADLDEWRLVNQQRELDVG